MAQTAYVLESTTLLEPPVAWHFERQETTTDITHNFDLLPATNQIILYRIREE